MKYLIIKKFVVTESVEIETKDPDLKYAKWKAEVLFKRAEIKFRGEQSENRHFKFPEGVVKRSRGRSEIVSFIDHGTTI